jgi:hypothetical protein
MKSNKEENALESGDVIALPKVKLKPKELPRVAVEVKLKDVRFSMSLTPREEVAMQGLANAFNCKTKSALLELALTVLSWTERELSAGRRIGSQDDDRNQFIELMIPGRDYHSKVN